MPGAGGDPDGPPDAAHHLADGDVLAAIAYHVPRAKDEQVMVTAIAARVDGFAADGRECALVVKTCLYEVASQLGRGGQLSLRISGIADEGAMADYGFRRGPQGKGRPAALFVQDPPESH
jgi:hypothetical protein